MDCLNFSVFTLFFHHMLRDCGLVAHTWRAYRCCYSDLAIAFRNTECNWLPDSGEWAEYDADLVSMEEMVSALMISVLLETSDSSQVKFRLSELSRVVVRFLYSTMMKRVPVGWLGSTMATLPRNFPVSQSRSMSSVAATS